jgi:hypothetical protein
MTNKVIIFLVALIAVTLLTLAQKSALWEQKVNAQIDFQKTTAGFLLKEAPDLKEIIILNRDLQITMYEMKREKYLYLITHYPGRIDPDKNLNFEWTDEDENNLTQSSKNYVSLKEKKEELYSKNQGHPMWPALRKMFERVKDTEEYKKAENALMEVLRR